MSGDGPGSKPGEARARATAAGARLDGGFAPIAETRCPVCGDPLNAATAVIHVCPSCRALHHRECWKYAGGCATYGCAHAPSAKKRTVTANWLLDSPKETPFVEWAAGGVTGGLYMLAGLVALCTRGWQDHAVPVFMLLPFATGFAMTVSTDEKRALKYAAILGATLVLPAITFGTAAAAGAFVLALVIAVPGMILGGVVGAIARRRSRKGGPPGPTLLLLAAVGSSWMLGDAGGVCSPTSDRVGWRPGCDRIPAARGPGWVREGAA